MKKSLIAVAGASLAAAAMPVVGVFAEGTFTDTVQVTVSKSCVWQASWTDGGSTEQGTPTGRTFSKDGVVPGTLLHFGGANDDGQAPGSSESAPIIKMECNGGDGTAQGGTWTVSAVGASEGDSNTAMKPSDSGVAIATGTATTGATSNWAFKIEATGGNVASGYGNYTSIPSTATTVLSGNASSTDITFTPGYQVYIGTDQAADTYTGKVTYTLASTF